MRGPTCIFWANLTAFSLKDAGKLFDHSKIVRAVMFHICLVAITKLARAELGDSILAII